MLWPVSKQVNPGSRVGKSVIGRGMPKSSQRVSNGVLKTLLGSVAAAAKSTVAAGGAERAGEVDSEAGGASLMASECTTSP